MARVQPEKDFDLVAIIDRLIEAAKQTDPTVKNYSQFAVAMGLSPQALNNVTKRQSMSLLFLISACKKYGLSLDYAVFGKEEEEAPQSDYINIERLGGGSVNVLAEVLPGGINADNLRADVDFGQLYIINIAETTPRTGMFAYGDPLAPSYLTMSRLSNGTFFLDFQGNVEELLRENSDITAEDVQKLNLVGRVIWHGKFPTIVHRDEA